MKKTPRSLFVTARSNDVAIGDDQIIAAFRKLASDTPSKQLEEAIAIISAQAAAGEKDRRVERGKEYAERIRTDVALMRNAIQRKDATSAALWGMRIVQTWMQLRWDAVSAGPHRHHIARVRNLAGNSNRPDDAEILTVVSEKNGRKLQAAALKTSVRNLQRWLREIEQK